ncbi:NAD(P)/FAD-dependent oxidoreductase [Phormidium pseudopriestleyi FRX01]|uniref:NAD(P)/FAD-dependent oxidoreductase n=1 Tax=Phormidium pseudopriestleyi FRX01 TaxID=1759528 RepID=A0ABS3FZ07_9CYAN|nr:NAD(P)/FAD-dependent oxidoreductase [Phormidium pseudopriestleyi]MBO0352351.1 NAD(P)/FAD-dependent oxidoreductase [Phormidium pseudopriestleyi FRX01]
MKNFDVIIVGAGPAGGHCARQLAGSGIHVLLVEQHETFAANNFSSAATPMETLAKYELPESIVGSFWQNLAIISTHVQKRWESSTPLGAVLNFAKLREFLAGEVTRNGGEVWLGHRYLTHSSQKGETVVMLKPKGKEEAVAVQTRVLVDATGAARSLMYPHRQNRPAFFTGIGIEYLITVDELTYQSCAESLMFFIGHRWMPQGYSWIFPMEPNILKVGAARYQGQHQILDDRCPAIKQSIELLIKEYLQIDDYHRLETHGSNLQYNRGLQDIYYRDNLIAIGDAVSAVNYLGGEGIRHGMETAQIAGDYIQDYLADRRGDFAEYQHHLHQQFKRSWDISERSAKKVYLDYSDRMIDKGLAYLGTLELSEVIDLVFYYRFEKITKGVRRILLRKLTGFWQEIRQRLGLSSRIS